MSPQVFAQFAELAKKRLPAGGALPNPYLVATGRK